MKEHIVISGDLAISCYGLLEENSNFEVVCEDEEDDSIWCEGNTETGEPFTSWEECVEHLLVEMYDSTIIEITAV
jgi:hypothetical protein